MIGFVRRSSTVDIKIGSGYRRFNGAYNTAFCNICNISPAMDNASLRERPTREERAQRQPIGEASGKGEGLNCGKY